jgi:uncharacterized protein YjbI with pentapeptide repeats
MKLSEDSSVITGVLYQNHGSTDTQLLGGLAIGVKLFDRMPITGFTYCEKNSTEDKLISGSRVTGIVYRDETSIDDRILRSANIRGVIFENREQAQGDAAGESANFGAARETSRSPQQRLLNGSQIVGIICRNKSTGEEEVTTGARVNMKILNGAYIAGIIYEGSEGERIKHLTGSNITGLLFQQQNSSSETLVGDMTILGLIYQEKDAIRERLANSNAISMAEMVILYMLLIVGILGLLLPAVLTQTDFSPLNFLALPSAVLTTLFVLMVVVSIVGFVYRRYRRSHTMTS